MKTFLAHLFKYAYVLVVFFVAIVPLALVQVVVAFVVTLLHFFVNVNEATQELYTELDNKIEIYQAARRFKKTIKETVTEI
jgi:hypothetical protein